MTKLDVAQLMSDQIGLYLGQRQPLIEAEPYDDEFGHGFDPLDRWGDARYSPYRSRWAAEGHPISNWKA